ncbi:MAG: hypothetical protein COA58_13955 [Bacteroidetes bacterium]|nr:MAG: hypothetical protein COA58_13955 [Bacteroidota bacterium]
MSKRVILVYVLAFLALTSKSSLNIANSQMDSTKLDIIYYGLVKSNEKMYIGVQGQWREILIDRITLLDSVSFMLMNHLTFDNVQILRVKSFLGMKLKKHYSIVPYGVWGNFLVIQRSYRVKRKFRFGHYWVNDKRDLLAI